MIIKCNLKNIQLIKLTEKLEDAKNYNKNYKN